MPAAILQKLPQQDSSQSHCWACNPGDGLGGPVVGVLGLVGILGHAGALGTLAGSDVLAAVSG